MRVPPGIVLVLYAAAGAGFIAGKIDLDVKIRELMHAQNLRIAQMHGAAVADALEQRKLAVKVEAAPVG